MSVNGGRTRSFQLEIEKIGASFFEVMTVMAVWYFKESNVEYAIKKGNYTEKQVFESIIAFTSKI